MHAKVSHKSSVLSYLARELPVACHQCFLPVYAKTYNLMAKQKWCVPTRDCIHTCMYYTSSRNNIAYVHITISVPRPTQNRMDVSRFSKARFSKHLERFCSMLLLHTATMVQTSRMPHFSFWNESYRFAPNSKFHSATKDREMNEQVELSQRKYSRRGVCSQYIARLVAKVFLFDNLASYY